MLQVDRSVSGLIGQQQCVGPLHLPLADVAVTALSYVTNPSSSSSCTSAPHTATRADCNTGRDEWRAGTGPGAPDSLKGVMGTDGDPGGDRVKPLPWRDEGEVRGRKGKRGRREGGEGTGTRMADRIRLHLRGTAHP